MQEETAGVEAEGKETRIESEADHEVEIEPGRPPGPSRFQRGLRTFLLWAVGLLGVFALGIAATWVQQVQPRIAVAETLRSDLEAVQSEQNALKAEVEQLRPLKDENAALQKQAEESELHLRLLRVLVDVTTAQLALTQENVAAAKASLVQASTDLSALKAGSTSETATIEGLQERVQLVLQEIDGDAFAARRDLEIMTNSLLALEKILFAE